MAWTQTTFRLRARSRGFHIITDEVLGHVPALRELRVGVCHLFIHHTSASLTLNENASADVRADFERHFDVLAPENAPYYRHTFEGPDDMPAHLKAALLGFSLSLPVKDGRLLLGTWQGIYLGEHREHGGSRTLTATCSGE